MNPAYLSPYTFAGGQTMSTGSSSTMTNQQSHADGTLSDDEYNWLVARAQGQFGNVTTCAAHVTLDGQGWVGELGVFSDDHIPGLTRLASGIRKHGSMAGTAFSRRRTLPQRTGQQPWSASVFELDQRGVEIPREATRDDILRTIDAFASAAKRCEQAGFDGVELHGAHGYLLGQFLGTTTNTRTDEWGGDLMGRCKFVFDVYDAVRAATSASFMVGIRLSPVLRAHGVVLSESLQTAQWFVERGADFIHASLWDSFKRAPDYPTPPYPVPSCGSRDLRAGRGGGVWTPKTPCN